MVRLHATRDEMWPRRKAVGLWRRRPRRKWRHATRLPWTRPPPPHTHSFAFLAPRWNKTRDAESITKALEAPQGTRNRWTEDTWQGGGKPPCVGGERWTVGILGPSSKPAGRTGRTNELLRISSAWTPDHMLFGLLLITDSPGPRS